MDNDNKKDKKKNKNIEMEERNWVAIQSLKDVGWEFEDEDIVREVIDGKEHILVFGTVDLKGFLKMLEAEATEI